MGFNLTTFKQLLVETEPVQLHDIEGTANAAFTLKLNGTTDYTITPDNNGNWYFDIPSGTTVVSLNRMFYDAYDLTSVSFKRSFDFSSVQDTTEMFYQTGNLSSIRGLSRTSMPSLLYCDYMFWGAGDDSSQTSIDISKWGLTNHSVESCDYMFANCRMFNEINVTNFVTSNVERLVGVFGDDSSRVQNIIGLNTWDTSNVTSMNHLFSDTRCQNLVYQQIENWDVRKVSDFSFMFTYCRDLTSLDLKRWYVRCQTSDYEVEFTGMFRGCDNLTNLRLSNFIDWPYDEQCMLYFLPNTNTLTLVARDPYDTVKHFFPNINIIPPIDVIGTMDASYTGSTITYSAGGTSYTANVDSTTHKFEIEDLVSKGQGNFLNAFKDLNKMVSIEFTDDVINLSGSWEGMFQNCTILSSFTHNFDKRYCAPSTLRSTFDKCNALTDIDLSDVSLRYVTMLRSTFYECINLEHIKLNTDTSTTLTSLRYCFYRCYKLTEIEGVEDIVTSSVTDVLSCFQSCSLITELDLSSWNTLAASSYTNFADNRNTLTIKYTPSIWKTAIKNALGNVNWVAV